MDWKVCKQSWTKTMFCLCLSVLFFIQKSWSEQFESCNIPTNGPDCIYWLFNFCNSDVPWKSGSCELEYILKNQVKTFTFMHLSWKVCENQCNFFESVKILEILKNNLVKLAIFVLHGRWEASANDLWSTLWIYLQTFSITLIIILW